ncbi:MAG: LamG-like jellyroll fold domain-containing protein, partial [Verrucomicrobiota bacterium]
LRVSTVTRSPDWIWAVWWNMASNTAFNCVDVPDRLGPTLPVVNLEPTWFPSNAIGFNATVNASGAVWEVSVYWGTNDGGTQASAWANSAPMGTFTHLRTDLQRVETLSIPTNWFYTWRAVNPVEDYWASPSIAIPGLDQIRVDNGEGATDLSAGSSALLQGNLSRNNAEVTIFWGTYDGGTNRHAWEDAMPLGPLAPGSFSSSVTGLLFGQTYYYRTYASNAFIETWADETTKFLTRTPLAPRGFTLTLCGYDREESLKLFTVLVELGPGLSPFFSYEGFMRPEGHDLRAYDAQGTELNYEVDTWNPAGASTIWIQVPRVDALTTTVRLAWGHLTETNQPTYTTNGSTWNGDYAAVWHLNETNGPIMDAARMAEPGVALGDPDRDESGVVGGADRFDNAGDSFSIPRFTHVNGSGALTVSGWSYVEDVGSDNSGDGGILSKGASSTNNFLLFYDYFSGGSDRTYTFNVGPVSVVNNRVVAGDEAGNFPMQWKHVTGVMNDRYRALYIDGVLMADHNSGGQRTVPDGTGEALLGTWEQSVNVDYHGKLDEVRVSTVARSSNWNWAVWLNMASNRFFHCAEP